MYHESSIMLSTTRIKSLEKFHKNANDQKKLAKSFAESLDLFTEDYPMYPIKIVFFYQKKL
ncbi:hypothetical protein RO3G_00112 [Rhizopus delemar RA 99-880]|uniref:Uncharacterized protein n=1 Tax=Rhizopus delemar (strain RA 99-880 / ATCC MYA-4621 / FGSC 9543 / NRRL 43880) TaxID=246409 RepID=I1BGS8_RHIO9|nr:hypothetical protein RO3G_00112 [Rhizopus delemar RA 99-880]|eukprot:EIE75408.1 hypothetical protein RO3G_00112 [Rhizopus delemar RA 99-880]